MQYLNIRLQNLSQPYCILVTVMGYFREYHILFLLENIRIFLGSFKNVEFFKWSRKLNETKRNLPTHFYFWMKSLKIALIDNYFNNLIIFFKRNTRVNQMFILKVNFFPSSSSSNNSPNLMPPF
jgi:hypothetical protein